MPMRHLAALCILAAVSLTLTVRAHHAMEFIETESYATSRQGEFLFHLHYDYMTEDKNDNALTHWEITPGLAYGITDRLMIDAHVHYAKFGQGLVVESRQAEFSSDGPPAFLEAAAFTLQYRLTEGRWLDVAVAGTVEVPFSRAEELLDAGYVYEGTLILAHTFENHVNTTLNLTYGEDDGEGFSEFALGIKTPLGADPHGIAAGLEWLGDLEDIADSWSLLPGIYLPLGSPQTVMKTGIEIAKDMERTRANVTVMHRF